MDGASRDIRNAKFLCINLNEEVEYHLEVGADGKII